ncbi:MAG TPA: hypothetical protein VL527_18570, partial [Dongiaceae bacterium]|nr:hypothetical protein [Dongiaceae bacterium]
LALRTAKGAIAYSPEVLADIDGQSAAILYRLLEFPTKPEADRLGLLTHDENYFGQNHSAPLCDEQTAVRLRNDGAQSLFQASRCYWPQGVVARAHPRLVSALRSGWTDPASLGRLGTWHGTMPQDAGITDEELSSMGSLLRGLAPTQVIFCGPLAPAVQEVFTFLWQKQERKDSRQPRLILAGVEMETKLRPEFLAQCVHVATDPAAAATIRTIRSRLAANADIALVLTSDVPEATAKALLHGLAPFLGRQGTVLVPCGRFDRFAITEEAPLIRLANDWFKASGGELGYGIWAGPAGARPHLLNWATFRRTPETAFWNRQWMPGVADIAWEETETATASVTA